MEQPTQDDTWLETLVFTSIFGIGPFRADVGEFAHGKARQLVELTGSFLVAGTRKRRYRHSLMVAI